MTYNLRKRPALVHLPDDDYHELRTKKVHRPPADFLSPTAVLELLSFTRKHHSIVRRVCKEWKFLSDIYVPRDENDIVEKPPKEFLGAEGYDLAVGKMPLKDAVRMVFQSGRNPLEVWGAIPYKLVPAIAKCFQAASIKKVLGMRGLKADDLRDTHLNDVHHGIGHTVFACAHCRASMVDHDPREEYHEYFHVRHPSSATQKLTIVISYYADSLVRDAVPKQYDIKTVCVYIDEKRCRFPPSPLRPLASRRLLSPIDLRLEVFYTLPRGDLDACSLVCKQWKGDIGNHAQTLSLHQGYVHFEPRNDGTVLFCVNRYLSEKMVEQRTFRFPKFAATDSAIVHSHMRNWTSAWLEVGRMCRSWKCAQWIPAAMRSLVNSDVQCLRYAVEKQPDLTVDMLQLAEICQTRTFELQTFQSYFEHAVDTGLFQHDLFRRLTNVQINIFPLIGRPDPAPIWLERVFRLRGMHLVIVYDQWPSVTLQIDSTFLEGVVSTIAKEFRERDDVDDFVEMFDLQFLKSQVPLGTPSGKPVKVDTTLDIFPSTTKTPTPTDHWDAYHVQNASSPTDVITVFVRQPDPSFTGCRIYRGRIDF